MVKKLLLVAYVVGGIALVNFARTNWPKINKTDLVAATFIAVMLFILTTITVFALRGKK